MKEVLYHSQLECRSIRDLCSTYSHTIGIGEISTDPDLSDTLILPPASSDDPSQEDLCCHYLPPAPSDDPPQEDLCCHNLRLFAMDTSIFHGSVPTPTMDNLLYPSHSTFLQDIINTGLSFLGLLGILWTLVLSTGIRVFFQTRILWNMAWSWCWGSIPIQIFFGTVLFWDTCLAIGSILNTTSLFWSRVHIQYPYKRHSLKRFPRRWMILSAIMINWSHGVHPASMVLDSLQCTSSRMCRLSALASLTPAIWCQFSAFKGHEFL